MSYNPSDFIEEKSVLIKKNDQNKDFYICIGFYNSGGTETSKCTVIILN